MKHSTKTKPYIPRYRRPLVITTTLLVAQPKSFIHETIKDRHIEKASPTCALFCRKRYAIDLAS
jgi:hypothetical protein